MASAIMHIAVAKKVNEYLNMEEKMLFLGTIAPDISKQINEPKTKSHFLTDGSDIPNVNAFYNKYKDYLNNPFEMGYYIHLLTDYYWFKDFIHQKIKNLKLATNKGNSIELKPTEITKILYNDYTNVNIDIIEHYDLVLKLFYEEIEYPRTKLNEIPINKLNIIVDKMGIIIEESKKGKTYVFNIEDIINFIDETAELIIKTIKDERKV